VTDVWVCATCHSLNRQRDQRCYKCGAKQADADTGALADTRTKLALQQRTVVRYRSSLLRALIAAGFILAVAALNLAVLVVSFRGTQFVREQIPLLIRGAVIDTPGLFAAVLPSAILNVVLQVCSLVALFCFSAWLSRVVMNIPALGGGTPGTTPTRAFIYPWIPIVNLIKVPPMIQDALYRLDPKAGGFFMILLAWLGLVGSAIVRFLFDNWQRLRFESIIRNAQTEEQFVAEFTEAFDLGVLVSTVTTLMISAGALVLVVVMFRIEARAKARDEEIRAAAAAAAGGATAVVADPPTAAPVAAPPPAPVAAPLAAAAPPPTPAPASLPFATGPRLDVTVGAGGIVASVDDSVPEPSTVDELRAAAPALARAGGSAVVASGPGADPAAVAAIVESLRAAGVPTQQR
jgi:hypothetical protein